jgi:hypothetical protein
MMRRALAPRHALLLALLTTAGSRSAFADDSRAAIRDDLHTYYDGEQNTAFLFLALGAASAANGAVFASGDQDFSRGIGWSMVAMGVLQALGSVYYASAVEAKASELDGMLSVDPARFKRVEAAHIHGTTSRFVLYRLSELGIAVAGAGVATYGFIENRDAWKGAGIGIAAEALTFFVLDSFGVARAHAYEERVRRFDPSLALDIGGRDRPWSMGMAARF